MQEYFVYCKAARRSIGEKDPATGKNHFRRLPNNKMYRIATRPGAMRYIEVSHMCIFPSDGISRIRFTGQSHKALSQPDASGPPKT